MPLLSLSPRYCLYLGKKHMLAGRASRAMSTIIDIPVYYDTAARAPETKACEWSQAAPAATLGGAHPLIARSVSIASATLSGPLPVSRFICLAARTCTHGAWDHNRPAPPCSSGEIDVSGSLPPPPPAPQLAPSPNSCTHSHPVRPLMKGAHLGREAGDAGEADYAGIIIDVPQRRRLHWPLGAHAGADFAPGPSPQPLNVLMRCRHQALALRTSRRAQSSAKQADL